MAAKNEFLQKRLQKFSWDAAVDGTLPTNASTSIGTLPKNALITGGYIDVITLIDDADDGHNTTLALGYTGATGAFLAAAAVSAYTAGLRKALLCGQQALDGNALAAAAAQTAIGAAYVKTATDVEVLMTVSNDQALDAGKINIFVEYVISE